ncbi:hypothetical protein [Streptomyces prunicolor]|uniref:hypothetical protein n=1 Tax=Streptomyces prunicolor TaxID=67348 RepID=UPI0003A6906C|nr:hypothetical protein [Streptomyces prunicolor]
MTASPHSPSGSTSQPGSYASPLSRPGETFRIGRPTQDVFSDTLTRRLPNVMAAWLPNEEFGAEGLDLVARVGETHEPPTTPPTAC